VKAKDEGAFNQRDAQQINGREGETATFLSFYPTTFFTYARNVSGLIR
jgi:hypothetical protein